GEECDDDQRYIVYLNEKGITAGIYDLENKQLIRNDQNIEDGDAANMLTELIDHRRMIYLSQNQKYMMVGDIDYSREPVSISTRKTESLPIFQIDDGQMKIVGDVAEAALELAQADHGDIHLRGISNQGEVSLFFRPEKGEGIAMGLDF
ncbi:MAG: hypothetical protein AAF226_05000, partial [Verrucomicrobiota bacterium]